VTTPPACTPTADFNVTASLVRRLLERQFPHLAAMPLTAAASGWDNEMFRLGGDLAVRLPRRELGALLGRTEWDWLGRVGADWTFRAPLPVAVGDPDEGYPWRWSVVPWVEGTPVLDAPLSPVGAADLGSALAQIHVPAPPGAPTNPFRSISLRARAERLDMRLATLLKNPSWRIDARAARVYVAAAASTPHHAADVTWCHLDLHGNNVLSLEGRLAGIIDWGDSGAGNPATDLGQALYLLGSRLFESCALAYANSGGTADPAAPTVRAEAVHYAALMASLDDERYAASGWHALADLGFADLR
jgi:aminoglycoside phosphotransferase (APT) family kinase protein